jgi:hypothetical protein
MTYISLNVQWRDVISQGGYVTADQINIISIFFVLYCLQLMETNIQ